MEKVKKIGKYILFLLCICEERKKYMPKYKSNIHKNAH